MGDDLCIINDALSINDSVDNEFDVGPFEAASVIAGVFVSSLNSVVIFIVVDRSILVVTADDVGIVDIFGKIQVPEIVNDVNASQTTKNIGLS